MRGGAEGQTRTVDTGIFSAVLYHLSYLGRDTYLKTGAGGCQGEGRLANRPYTWRPGPSLLLATAGGAAQDDGKDDGDDDGDHGDDDGDHAGATGVGAVAAIAAIGAGGARFTVGAGGAGRALEAARAVGTGIAGIALGALGA